ncbi:unnamed protein product [Rotaria sp. Silwood2]|nr:unnamed protein product [Rotaria sp. Silwood2]
MDKLSKSAEVLKLLSTKKSETLIIEGNNENYFKLITPSVKKLFPKCNENDYNVQLTAEETLNQLVKVL